MLPPEQSARAVKLQMIWLTGQPAGGDGGIRFGVASRRSSKPILTIQLGKLTDDDKNGFLQSWHSFCWLHVPKKKWNIILTDKLGRGNN